MSDRSPDRSCRLHAALGRAEACPEAACGFWEPGGAALDGRCAFELVDMTGRAELAAVLLDVRSALESAGSRAEKVEARKRFHRALNVRPGE
jgi:hypothetical protein